MPDFLDKSALIQLQIELEYDQTEAGDLVPRDGSTQRARLLVYEFDGQHIVVFRHDVPISIRQRILSVPLPALLRDHSLVRRHLAVQDDCADIWYGSSFTFPYVPASHTFKDVVRRGDRFTIVKEGEEVSAAWPARENDKSSEVIVETKREYQRRGYGSQVVSAWASNVLGRGMVPFYSYESNNMASKALARRLILMKFCDVVAYD